MTVVDGRGARVDGLDVAGRAPDLDELDADRAITVIFDEHYARMLRVATVLLDDAAAAEDVVQESFLALHQAWDRVRDKRGAAGYLHRSVVNGSRSRLRRRRVSRRLPHPPEPPTQDSAEAAVLSGTIDGTLLAALHSLPAREREVVLFRYYLDLSERRTAEVLGLRPGSVKAYGSRGLAALRARLGRALDDEEGLR